jgi:Peptidase family M28
MDMTRSAYERRVRDLVGFGHRGSGTDNERRAAEYLMGELSGLGYAPAMEPFRGSGSLGLRLLLHVVVAAVGLGLLWWVPIASAFLGWAALFSLVIEQTSRGMILSRALPRPESQNVTATCPGGAGVRRRVVVCGHYDTQRTGLLWHEEVWRRVTPLLRRLPAALQSPLLPVCLAMTAQVVLGIAAAVGGEWARSVAPTAVLAVIYGVTAVLLAEWSVRGHVPGAADNASGAAAVLAIAEEWERGKGGDTELVLLLPGCEETGLLGAAAWAERHAAELRAVPTVFVNLDGLGFGPTRVLEAEVPLAGWPVRYPRELVELCREAGIPDLSVVPGYTDGTALLARGLRGATVIGIRSDGRLPHWHQLTDDFAHMDLDAAWEGVTLAGRVVRRLREERVGSAVWGGGLS